MPSYYTYVEAVGIGFPGVQCSAPGAGDVYETIVWNSTVISKEALDAWILANPKAAEIVLTKYEFRKLFSFSERVAIDNIMMNPNVSDQNKAILTTIMKDLETSGSVFLTTNSDVATGLSFVESLGLIAPGRKAQILANQPPV